MGRIIQHLLARCRMPMTKICELERGMMEGKALLWG